MTEPKIRVNVMVDAEESTADEVIAYIAEKLKDFPGGPIESTGPVQTSALLEVRTEPMRRVAWREYAKKALEMPSIEACANHNAMSLDDMAATIADSMVRREVDRFGPFADETGNAD